MGLGLVAVAGALLLQGLPESTSAFLRSESGPFEMGSIVLLGAAAALAAWQFAGRPSWTRIAGLACVAGLLLRELDFQKRFTYRSVESFGFYTRPIASWSEKVIAATVLLALAAAGLHLARAAWRHLPRAIARGESWVRAVPMAAGLIALGLVSEKFLHLLVAEEVFETTFAVVVLGIVWQCRGQETALLSAKPLDLAAPNTVPFRAVDEDRPDPTRRAA